MSASSSPRLTRSRVKALAAPIAPLGQVSGPSEAVQQPTTTTVPGAGSIIPLPHDLTQSHTGLSRTDHALLAKKQAWLARNAVSIPQGFARNRAAVDATLVFGQEEAGTAVCIASEGLLLTCSHCCVDEEGNRPGRSKIHWLIFSSGTVVGAKRIAWDEKRDLALLRIVKAQPHDDDVGRRSRALLGEGGQSDGQFPSVKVATEPIALSSKMMCIGHPGSEDLEADEAGLKTGYDVLHASTGRFRGHFEGQDVQDNSEIGALMHDCWTYWGHSGAPLLAWTTGQLAGLHSSWDDETAMRRGVALEAIREFLQEHGFARLI
ncbi:AT hook domain-containing protein family protein [Apiospora rasikravindrae]|uniref:AT hook domain-containing protein family protein n=1 Tax=Apiospora rasikravindrae TaxID=990691 RepID=A0ABR1TFT7_9PEZI